MLENKLEASRRSENQGLRQVSPRTKGEALLPPVDRELNLRAKICPYTFVESMLALEEMEIGQVLRVKRICILTLSFLILSSAFANLCSATSSSFPGADQAPHLKDQSYSQHDHEQSPHKDKSLCHKSLLCCPSLTQGSSSYSFVLDARLVTPVEIFPKPFEMAEPVYHPPKIVSGLSPSSKPLWLRW